MIRWTESHDAYRLSINRVEDGVAHALIGVGLGLLGLSGTGCAMGAILAPFFIVRAVWLFSQHYWVELPLRGGPVRWWWRGMEGASKPVEVRRFDVEAAGPSVAAPYRRFQLVAVLPNGGPLRPLKGLTTADPRIVERVARQLNEVLGVSPEEEELSAAPEVIESWRDWRSTHPGASVLVLVLILILLAALLLPALVG